MTIIYINSNEFSCLKRIGEELELKLPRYFHVQNNPWAKIISVYHKKSPVEDPSYEIILRIIFKTEKSFSAPEYIKKDISIGVSYPFNMSTYFYATLPSISTDQIIKYIECNNIYNTCMNLLGCPIDTSKLPANISVIKTHTLSNFDLEPYDTRMMGSINLINKHYDELNESMRGETIMPPKSNYTRLENLSLFGNFKFEDTRTKIKKVLFNGPATIVFWEDGEKTIVKCTKNDVYDPEKAILMAFYRKVTGLSKTQTKKSLDKLMKKDADE